ncbi:sulfite exporter TauE/SafE family protein [Flindersiella endophytica]
MDISWPLVLAGALVGLVVGMTGMGGGALMTPIMVLIFGINPTAAIGSDLATSLFMKPFGAAVHHRAGTVRWDIVRWLLPTAIPAAFAGAFLLQLLGDGQELQDRAKLLIGAALLLMVCGVLIRMLLDRRRNPGAAQAGAGASAGAGDNDEPVRARPLAIALIGLAGGLLVGLTSVGSGSLIIVLLMLTHPRLRANHLVATDLVQAIPLVAAATAGHLIFGDANLGLAAVLLIGAIPGVVIGALVSVRAPSGALRWILAVVLLGSGLSLLHVPSAILLTACAALAATAAGTALMSARRTKRAETTEVPQPAASVR